MNTLVILATLPVFLILYYVYRKDVNKEPISKLLLTLFVGCLSVIPASIMELYLETMKPADPISGGLYEGFVVAAFSEELCKFLLLLLVIWRSPHFNEYFDGIIYAVFISMGFAGVENLMYVFQSGDYATSVGTAVVRAIVSVPGHFLFAVAMGYFLSLARFDPAHRKSHLIKSILYPILLHGTFDAILMVSENLQTDETIAYLIGTLELVIFVIFDIRMWRKGIRRINHLQQLSQQQDFDRRNPFANFRWNF